jgi:pimeloyl-ACP methyl ester carboxylesterase
MSRPTDHRPANNVSPRDDPDAERAEIQGISIAWEERGEGTPILLIHGWSADRRSMLADLEPIFEGQPGWRRLYLDLPGHGATAAPGWLSTQDQMLSILLDFIDAVLPDQSFAVAGNSYGGNLALAMVRSIPDRLLGAALLVPWVPGPDGASDAPPPVTLRGQTRGHHWPVRVWQIVARFRHFVRRGPTALCRIAVDLRPPVLINDGQARSRPCGRPKSGHFHRTEIHFA